MHRKQKTNGVFLLCFLSLQIFQVYSDECSLENLAEDIESILHPPTFTELAAQYGHPAETHRVTTEDGYILTLFHLQGNTSRRAPPILLFHGILDSSDTWIIRGNRSLSITLANDGYDVWLGNVRGNRYSLGHVTLDPAVNNTYWDFSYDEHGLYDLPATIDYVLINTGAEKLNLIGHSQGTTITWVLLSTRTEYNDKINVATALAPLCYLSHALPPLSIAFRIIAPLYPLLVRLGVTSVLGDNSLATLAFRVISRVPVLGYLIDAYGILFTWFGVDSTELEPSFLPTVAQHVPTSTSIKNIAHFGQNVISDEFMRFDYGEEGNRAAYNSSTPPLYELGNVRARVVLLAALNDKTVQMADLQRLRSELPNVVEFVINPRRIMNHLDYIWGRTEFRYLYPYIFDVLARYN